MPSRTGRQNSNHPLTAVARLPCRLRALARALHRWWMEERHYRPERRYMRG